MATTIEVRGACPHDCPDTCAWIAGVEDGVVTGVHGDKAHPLTAGHLCVKMQSYEERVYHPDRLLSALVRTGPKGGRGGFREATWDEALDRVRAGLEGAIERGGPLSVLPYNYMGTQGMLQGGPCMDARFFNRLGAADLLGTICFAAGSWAWGLTYPRWAPADIEDAVHARTVVAWGANMVSTHLHLWKAFLDARKRGATIICVDPVRTRTAKAADVHLQLRPGSDGALALGLAQVLFTEGLVDRVFLAARTEGAEAFEARAAEWPLDRAAAATGLAPEVIAATARQLAAGPMFVKVGPGAQRHAHAGQGVRAVLALPALTGAWQQPGGRALVASAAHFEWPELGGMALRADGPRRTVNMIQLGRALDGTLDEHGPLGAIVVYNSNPAVVAPDSQAVRRGLARDDLFVVALEQFPTETVRYADVVLPATTQLEHLDVLWSWGHQYLTLNRPAIAPRGQSRPNTEIFRMLAGAMGFDDKPFADDDEALLAQYLDAYSEDVVRRLHDQGWAKVGRSTPPDAKVHLASSRAASLGLDPVPDGTDPPGDDGRVAVVTPKSHHFLNSSLVNHERLRTMAKHPAVQLSEADAERFGVADGDLVEVRSDHGALTAVLSVGNEVAPGTAAIIDNWWHEDFPGGRGVNVLHGQDTTDLGGAPIFTARATVRRVS